MLAKCSKCGFEVVSPVKTWLMLSRPSKLGNMLGLTIGLYECPNCKKKFRRVLEKERISLKGIIERIKSLEKTIMEAAKKRSELEEKLYLLEEEKTRLLSEIEALKAIPELENKISSLEPEIAELKEEKKVLEERIAEFTSSHEQEATSAETPETESAPAETPETESAPAETPETESAPAETPAWSETKDKPIEASEERPY